MDFILIMVGLFILHIFLFKREILVQKQSAPYIGIACITLLALGFVLTYFNIKIGKALTIPFFQFISYRFCHFIFVKIYRREPKDTWWTMDLSLMIDGVFNFLCMLFAFGLLMLLIL